MIDSAEPIQKLPVPNGQASHPAGIDFLENTVQLGPVHFVQGFAPDQRPPLETRSCAAP